MNPRRIVCWLLMTVTWIAVQAGRVELAQASCGDYLEGHHRPIRVDSAVSGERAEQSESLPGRIPTCPCQGPTCQKAPSAPAAPVLPPNSVPTTHEPACSCATPQTLPESDVWRGPREELAAVTAGHQPSIEHPPRV